MEGKRRSHFHWFNFTTIRFFHSLSQLKTFTVKKRRSLWLFSIKKVSIKKVLPRVTAAAELDSKTFNFIPIVVVMAEISTYPWNRNLEMNMHTFEWNLMFPYICLMSAFHLVSSQNVKTFMTNIPYNIQAMKLKSIVKFQFNDDRRHERLSEIFYCLFNSD